jgi:hypothetical protein
MEFIPFQKLARLYRDVTITEKIDGTNALIHISTKNTTSRDPIDPFVVYSNDQYEVRVGSRTQWITPKKDNFGFAQWVVKNVDNLLLLGPGSHFGEWYGQGIQIGYGMKERRFVLFNAGRWNSSNVHHCIQVVPILFEGVFSEAAINESLDMLRNRGSHLVPGWNNPEGIVIYHEASGKSFKVTLNNDGRPKSKGM